MSHAMQVRKSASDISEMRKTKLERPESSDSENMPLQPLALESDSQRGKDDSSAGRMYNLDGIDIDYAEYEKVEAESLIGIISSASTSDDPDQLSQAIENFTNLNETVRKRVLFKFMLDQDVDELDEGDDNSIIDFEMDESFQKEPVRVGTISVYVVLDYATLFLSLGLVLGLAIAAWTTRIGVEVWAPLLAVSVLCYFFSLYLFFAMRKHRKMAESGSSISLSPVGAPNLENPPSPAAAAAVRKRTTKSKAMHSPEELEFV